MSKKCRKCGGVKVAGDEWSYTITSRDWSEDDLEAGDSNAEFETREESWGEDDLRGGESPWEFLTYDMMRITSEWELQGDNYFAFVDNEDGTHTEYTLSVEGLPQSDIEEMNRAMGIS